MKGIEEPAVSIKGLTKIFPKETRFPIMSMLAKLEGPKVVKGLDLEIPTGEVFGFLGPNGAGKSTVMAMITGILRPTKGRIKVFGLDIAKDGPRARERIGFAPEVPALYGEMSPVDLVAFHGSFYGLGSKAKKRARDVLDRLGLTGSLDQPVSKLSYGNQKKVSLAIALVHEPDLLLLDEPTTGLDPGSVILFRDIVKDLKKKDKTIFLSSHVLTEVEMMCGLIGILVQGQLKLMDRTEKVLQTVGPDGAKPSGLEQVFLGLTSQDPPEAPKGGAGHGG
jgi:ABC-2 type transport system ATP-binding protein